MTRILLANEAGTGRGHITTLKVFAQALGPDFVYDAALCRLHHAADIAPLCELVFQGAALRYDADTMALRAGTPFGNWAEFLASIGFANQAFLTRQIDWWIRTIKARCSDLVVAEFAPCAMLAARALGVPVISIGQGHSAPPSGMAHFPLPATGTAGLVHAEADLVGLVNRAAQPFGLQPLQHFSDIYRCDAQFVRTIPALDPYAAWRSAPIYLAPLGLDCPNPGSGGDEIFVYFSTSEGSDPVIADAIAAVDLPMRVVMPAAEPALVSRLQARGVAVELAPLPHALIAARSRMLVHAGQHGATSLGLALGLPQVALPRQSEQLANARCVEAMGTLASFPQPRRDSAAIAAAVARVYADADMARRAVALAHDLRGDLVGDTAARIRSVVAPLLGRTLAA